MDFIRRILAQPGAAVFLDLVQLQLCLEIVHDRTKQRYKQSVQVAVVVQAKACTDSL